MSDIVIRDVMPGDVPAIREVVRDVWAWEDFFESSATVDACIAIYFAPVLHEATFGRVALLDGKVVGVIFGVADGETPCYKHLLENLSPHIVTLLQASESDRLLMCEYTTKLRDVYAELISGIEHEYNGVLDFLALSKAAQGKGIGKLLWLALKSYFEEKNVTKVYLYSDSECNFGFYESRGFSKRLEKDICFVCYDEKEISEQYLYEYSFK